MNSITEQFKAPINSRKNILKKRLAVNTTLNTLQVRFLLKLLLAQGCEAVSIFVNDDASAPIFRLLNKAGVTFLVLRSANFNYVNIAEAQKFKIKVARVAEYSPYAVAEHRIALMFVLNRKLIRAHNKIQDQNLSLDGLLGFDVNRKNAKDPLSQRTSTRQTMNETTTSYRKTAFNN